MGEYERYIERLEAGLKRLADTIPKGRQATAGVSLPIAMDELRWRIVDIWRKQDGEDSLFEGDDDMACPTCDHTMHKWGEAGEVFVCPRCGTVRDSEGVQVPKLVERVIEFAGHLTYDEHQDLIDVFERLGIRESITTPMQERR